MSSTINKDLRKLYQYVDRNPENPTIKELFFEENNEVVNYSPSYQRYYVWSIEKATKLIETIILNGEIPPLTVTRINNVIEIIDGRQRYESIKKFCENKFRLKKSGLNKLPELEGCTYTSLPENAKEILQSFKLRLIVYSFKFGVDYPIECEELLKRDLFRRYNSGMSSLSKNEVARASYAYDKLSQLFESKIKNNEEPYVNFINVFIPKSKRNIEKRELINLMLVNIRELLTIPYISIIESKNVNFSADIIDEYYNRYVLAKDYDEIIQKFETIIKKTILIKEKLASFNNPVLDNILFFKAVYWMLSILYDYFPEDYYNFSINKFCNFIEENPSTKDFFDNYKNMTSNSIIERHNFMKKYLENELNISIANYLNDLKEAKEALKRRPKKMIKKNEIYTKLATIHSVISRETSFKIKDIIDKIVKGRFFVRPFYQREEISNKNIASKIIESIILGIKLPPIYVYSRKGNDGVPIYEVIDGQQRIISILSFLGELITNAEGELARPKKFKFKLTNLRGSEFLNNKTCDEIESHLLEQILNYEIDCLEITENNNTEFKPVDMFLRLNSKPYPILYNSFEMWNSFDCVDILSLTKQIAKKYSPFLKQNNKKMKNEELIITLAYFDFKEYNIHNINNVLRIYMYNKDNELKVSFDKKFAITILLEKIEFDSHEKEKFINSVKEIEIFLEKINTLFDNDPNKLIKILNPYIDKPRKGGAKDFYLLYLILKEFNKHFLLAYKQDIINDISDIYKYMKKIPEGKQVDDFIKFTLDTINKYNKYK